MRNGKRGHKGPDQTAQLQAEIQRLRTVVAELSVENLVRKGDLALSPRHWYGAEEKALTLETEEAQVRTDQSVAAILNQLQLPPAYYRGNVSILLYKGSGVRYNALEIMSRECRLWVFAAHCRNNG